jgi:hypothetical protein
LSLGFSGLLSRERHCRRFWFLRFGHPASTFLHSLAPPELPGFLATMSALTPERRALRTCWAMNTRRTRSGLPALRERTFRPFRLQPPLVVPGSVCFLPGLTAFCLVNPVCRGRTASWASPLPSRLATTKGRIEFVILRTGRSPPVALHPLSQGRSYYWLQNSNQTPTGTSTPLIHSAHRRTRSGSA